MDKTYVFTRKQLVAFAKEILRRAAEDERQERVTDLRSKLEAALTLAFTADPGKVETFASTPQVPALGGLDLTKKGLV